MCQQSVQDTGDISVTASDAVYDFDIGVRCFLIIGIILGTVDNGAEGMTLRAMYNTLCGCHDGDWILLREALHNALGIAFLQEGQTRRVLGAEEDVHIRQNGFDAFLRLGAGPQVPTEVHIEGDDGPLCFKALDHLNSGSSQLRAESQCDAAGMEAAGIAVDLVIIVINGQLVDGGILTVIHNTGLSWVSTILIVVHAQSGILVIIVYQIVIADTAETYTVLDIYTQVIGRKLGNDAAAQSQHCRTGNGIQFCASCLLAEAVASGNTLIVGR